jgi:hypothetical protein
MALIFGAPLSVPAGKLASRDSFDEPARYVRHYVHDVRVTLDGHELVHHHGARLADPAEVVSAEVHEHDVLGPLFGVAEEVFFQCRILFLVPAPLPRAGDGFEVHVRTLHPYEHLGGGAHECYVLEPQEEHVRRRVYDAQRPVYIKRVHVEPCREPL